jgi:hypothetical protein
MQRILGTEADGSPGQIFRSYQPYLAPEGFSTRADGHGRICRAALRIDPGPADRP